MILDLKRIFVNENSSLPIEYALDMSGVEFSGTYPLKSPLRSAVRLLTKQVLPFLMPRSPMNTAHRAIAAEPKRQRNTPLR